MNIARLIRDNDYLTALWELANVLEHDAACWKEVARKSQDNAVVQAMAQDRIKSLHIEVDRVYEAILDKHKELDAANTQLTDIKNHSPNNWDYTKRIRRKGYGWKEGRKS